MIRILNTWKSDKENFKYYEFDDKQLIAKKGDYSVYSQWDGSVVYAYKCIAVNNLVKYNKDHLNSLYEEHRPNGEYSARHLIFDSAMKTKQKGLSISQQTTIQ